MHLEGPWLSTTSTRKRAEKLTKSKREELERGWRERNQWLKGLNLPKDSFEQYLEWVYGLGKKSSSTKELSQSRKSTPTKIFSRKAPATSVAAREIEVDTKSNAESNIRRPWITGPCSSKPSPTYTGTKVIGIGTMHKSNMVPIFNDEEAKDISKMRR